MSFFYDPDVAVASAVEPVVEVVQEKVRGAVRLHNGTAKAVVDEYIFLQNSIEMVLDLVGFDLPVPLLQDINKKSELFVLLIQFVGVKLMKLELRIVFGPKKVLNILLKRVTIVECHDILQGCAHVSI